MSLAELEKPGVIQLDWNEADGVVTITPRDQDRFSVKMRRAIAMLQQSSQQEAFDAQFQVLLNTLGQWVSSREDIGNAYLTLRDGALAFVVVRDRPEYESAFEDQLSELDLAIANDVDLDLINLNVLALPPVSREALDSFLNPQFRLSYGERIGSHCAGEQEPRATASPD